MGDRLMTNRVVVTAALVLVGCGVALIARAEPNLFVGEWDWNRAESSGLPGEPPPRDEVLTIGSADIARVQWTVTTVDAQGQQHTESYTGTGDGKAAQIPGAPEGTMHAFTVTNHSLEAVYISKDGNSDRSSCEVSTDRKKMTCRGTESDGKGHSANYVDVYDRK
jgi:hypothetical protein